MIERASLSFKQLRTLVVAPRRVCEESKNTNQCEESVASEMLSAILGRKRNREPLEEPTTIRERDVRKWQDAVVEKVFMKKCLRKVPYNLKPDENYVVMGFYIPPTSRIDGSKMQELVRFGILDFATFSQVCPMLFSPFAVNIPLAFC